MTGTKKEISLDALCLANYIFTKNLIATLVGTGNLSKEQMQAVFDATKHEFHRTTLSVGPKEADELMTLLWRDYVPSTVDPKPN